LKSNNFAHGRHAESIRYPEQQHPEFINPTSLSKEDIDRAIVQLMGQVKVIMAYFYRRTQSQTDRRLTGARITEPIIQRNTSRFGSQSGNVHRHFLF
jgi:hypothetical protein